MVIGDVLYFAPNIRFRDVDLHGAGLPAQYAQRIEGFYIAPAADCASRDQAFASGVLLVSCIDALARARYGINAVGERFKRFAEKELPSFRTAGLAERFYDEFRNGLVHEGRIKNGGQFSLEVGGTIVIELDGLLMINPAALCKEVQVSLDSYVDFLRRDAAARQSLSQALARDHAKDFAKA